MKVYVIEYDFTKNLYNNKDNEIEHRIETFNELQIGDFIDRVKVIKGNDGIYNNNIKVYSGEVEEIDINKVLNPF
ncbi:hypothetical protein [Clostridium botulinum]|uniref:hypothetical protein n=1 Tax=Clostridium botulinum TaxID=1491 RepID=UPI001E3A5C2D|nr:hypothetical protein [Clostridium botulinum]MCD3329306.1 hypothetical protein [Clostridium botulinum D/C]MCD3344525.1 hypothetical protein [Clostridium botulinum D/C]MCD3353005.1 hypothetical protein [Clostridium botulinum D/C]